MPGGVISDDYELLELLGKPTSKKITNNISFLSISNVLLLLPELPNIARVSFGLPVMVVETEKEIRS